MNTFAPELSALMTILRSTGPVISTRRSIRSAGIGATVHSLRADLGGLGKKIGKLAGVDLGLASLAPRQQLLPAGVELSRQAGQKAQSFRSQNLRLRIVYRRFDFNPRRAGLHACGHSNSIFNSRLGRSVTQ